MIHLAQLRPFQKNKTTTPTIASETPTVKIETNNGSGAVNAR